MQQQLEYKSTPLKLDDFSSEKRTAVIAHATYDNIDRLNDISRKGMFTKSWNEHGPEEIGFLENHEFKAKVGTSLRVWEDDQHGYTQVKFGEWTKGNDMMLMVEAKAVTDASFGFLATKSKPLIIKGKKVRELNEVYHGETTLVNGMLAINPMSGVKLLTKAMNGQPLELKALSDSEQRFLAQIITAGFSNIQNAINLATTLDTTSDLYSWVMSFISTTASWLYDARSNLRWGSKATEQPLLEMKAHLVNVETFVHNGKASQECLAQLDMECKAFRHIISLYDTPTTQQATEQGGSVENEVYAKLISLNAKL